MGDMGDWIHTYCISVDEAEVKLIAEVLSSMVITPPIESLLQAPFTYNLYGRSPEPITLPLNEA